MADDAGAVEPAAGPERGWSLPEAARQQLVTIAADVMGRRPVAELPPAVRRFARFAPAKRLRLGASEIATALDTDEGFRQLVAQVVVDTSPELAEQIRSGRVPPTAEPVDVAVITYLTRPPGWSERLSSLSEQLAAIERRRADDAELSDLRQQIDRLAEQNAQLARDRERARAALADAGSAQADQLAEATRRVRTLTGELRSARRQLDELTVELAQVRAEADVRAAADSAELRRMRARADAAEAELDTARRAARSGRDHDQARLWVLLETLSSAVTGLRRELDVVDPGVRPADLARSGPAVTGNRPSVVDGPLLDRLLDTGSVHLVVDGYNVTKTGYGELTLAEQRTRLVSSLGPLAARTAAEVTVAFDGTAAPLGAAAAVSAPRGVRVLFSAPGQLADDLIRDLLRAEPTGRLVLVASSDQAVAASARAAAAWPIPAPVLLARLER
ncbi:MAG TPA: NYN domain-containing protein [Jatrophihabitans sp.]|nr:NYN domain-containing protein [Jatrophihabitans sp.]